jgi:hypothetical protein
MFVSTNFLQIMFPFAKYLVDVFAKQEEMRVDFRVKYALSFSDINYSGNV